MFEQITITTRVSGPKEPPSDQSTSWPSQKMDKGKAKMTEYEDDQFNGNESTHSLNNEFGDFDVPIMKTLKPLPRKMKNFDGYNEYIV